MIDYTISPVELQLMCSMLMRHAITRVMYDSFTKDISDP